MRKHALRLIVSASVSLPASFIGLAATAEPPLVQGKQPRTRTASPSLVQSPRKNLYGKLFQPPALEPRQIERAQPHGIKPAPALPPGGHEPIIECKIRAIPANPSIDRGILVSKPALDAKPAMRMLEHPCLKQ